MTNSLIADPFHRDSKAQIPWPGLPDRPDRIVFKADHAALVRKHVEPIVDPAGRQLQRRRRA